MANKRTGTIRRSQFDTIRQIEVTPRETLFKRTTALEENYVEILDRLNDQEKRLNVLQDLFARLVAEVGIK